MRPGLSGSLSVLWTYINLLLLATAVNAIKIDVLQPIRSTGKEVGLVFIPDFHIKGEQYNETAHAIQASSNLTVWAALTEDYTMNVPDLDDVFEAIDMAIFKLKRAGMTSKDFVGVGHGRGGDFLQKAVKYTELKAIVLMGSTLPLDTPLRTFPIPVLTLSAELDGLVQITRIAEEYKKLPDQRTWNFFRGLYRTPVIIIEGANHAQFASGDMPLHIEKGDLSPNITDEQAHLMIGKYVSAFVTAVLSTNDSQAENALGDLAEAFSRAAKRLQPFLDIKNLDNDGEESMWTVLAQDYFADEYGNKVAVYNQVLENPSFFSKHPTFTKVDSDNLIIGTVTLVHVGRERNFLQIYSAKEISKEIHMKLVSKDAIWKAVASKNDTSLRSAPNTCKSLNQLALSIALTLSGEKVQERYRVRGRPIIFEEDTILGANILWAPTPFQIWEEGDGLHVKAVSMVSFKEHYCKVMSLYHAMEWVNVDSLREYED